MQKKTVFKIPLGYPHVKPCQPAGSSLQMGKRFRGSQCCYLLLRGATTPSPALGHAL